MIRKIFKFSDDVENIYYVLDRRNNVEKFINFCCQC